MVKICPRFEGRKSPKVPKSVVRTATRIQRAQHPNSAIRQASKHYLIVGLNVATKGAPPFSRGKQLVPGKQDVLRYLVWFHTKNFYQEYQKLIHDFLASIAPMTFLVIIGFYLRFKNSSP